jgi:putative hemolysin
MTPALIDSVATTTPLGQRVLGRRCPSSAYRLRRAVNPADVRAAQALRFLVFNLELNEGLEESYRTCLDADPFDAVCDHLLVEHVLTGEVVGTYRLQAGREVTPPRTFYCAQEFDFTPFESLRSGLVELGRACVHRQHRNLAVLSLLWRGIADYARAHRARYLVGCSSLPGTDPAVGATAYSQLMRQHLAPGPFRTLPQPGMACPLEQLAPAAPRLPRLFAAYLSLGAWICGPPALDRDFGTIDFLTFIDLEALPPEAQVDEASART